ncbi:flagellin [Roseomonas sp. GC11]|nr:flagellin [Roseomonas sp. GC11]
MTALQSLQATQKNLLQTQNRISTGLKVSTAKDNAATWAVATTMRSDIANYKQVGENLSVSSSILSTAETAATQIADLVKTIRTKVSSASNPAVDKSQVQADIDSALDQINTIASAAAMNGVNLVDGGTSSLRILSSVNQVNGVSTGSYLTVSGQNLKIEDGSLLEDLQNLTVLSRADQTFTNTNDGVEKVTLTVGSATSGLNVNSGNYLNFDYIDADGTERTLTVKATEDISSVADLVTYLNSDTGFNKLFKADRVYTQGTTLDAARITISVLNRDSEIQLGSYSTGTAGLTTEARTFSTALVISTGTGSAGNFLTTGSTTGASFTSLDGGFRRLDVTFVDGGLEIGDTFSIKVANGFSTSLSASATATYMLKVVDDGSTTGQLLVGDAAYSNTDNVFVIAVAAADVSADLHPNLTGIQLAGYIQTALTTGATNVATAAQGLNDATADFSTGTFLASGAAPAAATAGTDFAVAVDATTGLLSIINASGVDTLQVLSFNSSKTDYDVLMSKIDTATTNVQNAAAAFGTAGNRVDQQKDFLSKLVDTLTTGLGALVDADMSEEAARLQALQVQEQLGTQALSIANSAPQTILRLFQ